MNSALILSLAFLLDATFGEPRWLWARLTHPAVAFGHLIKALESRLNKGDHRKAKGVLGLIVLMLTAGVAGWVLSWGGSLMELVIAAILLAQRSLVEHVRAVADGLRQSLPQGRRAVSMIVSRDTRTMDSAAVARSAIESGAENMSDGVIAPALWFLVAGLPGMLIYKAVNTADSMIGYRTPRYTDYGWAAARMDDLLNLVPARLTALLIALPGGVATDLRDIAADARLHKSPNAGWPEAAMSRAVGVALAGPRTYDGKLQDFPFVHRHGTHTITPAHVDATCRHLWQAWGMMLGLTGLITVIHLL